MDINLDRYVLCIGVNGEPILSEDGKIYVSNIDDNTMIQLGITEHVSKHFGIVTCEETVNSLQYSNKDCEEKSASWSSAAVKNLIDLYKKHEKLFKGTSIKKQKVWNIITASMKENGHLYTATQCENKFKYLKSRYTKKKDNMGDRGSDESPLKFEYCEEMDDIFGRKPNITHSFIDSSIPQCSKNVNIENEEPSIENRENYEPVEKRRKVEEKNKSSQYEKEQNKLINFMQKRDEKKDEARDRRHHERITEAKETRQVYTEMMQKLIDKL